MNRAAIHVGSPQTSLSPSCFIRTFRELGLRVMNHQKYCDAKKYIVVTDASNHVNISSLNWCSSCDKTHELGSYEEIAFKASKDVFFVPNHIVVTLDDDLIGSRSKDVQNKLLSQRKAAKEGHATDVLCVFFVSCIALKTQKSRRKSNNECVPSFYVCTEWER